MSLLSTSEAQIVIDKILTSNGGVKPEVRALLPAEVLEALENLQRKLGSATKTLATNLYSKDTRFVFELIQNAEDNSYSRALANDEQPYIAFSVFDGRIVIDSNEDGFNENNVRAICSTGESTKKDKGPQGYIGEKGIGFKSVFKVASKVHIHSGPFSFYFKHAKGDNGLGMVTPINEESDKLPEGVRTRIQLFLHDPSKSEQHIKELRELPDTLLLFLSKIKTLSLKVHNGDSELVSSVLYEYDCDEGSGIGRLTKTTTENSVTARSVDLYRITKRKLTHLPEDEARENNHQAEVVLAFPVDEKDVPIIKQQHTFAFLPLRKVGFSFVIQSDFVTQASREDVFHSARNKALLDGVADAFCDAIKGFCHHATLRYTWPRFLPPNSISDSFWSKLYSKVFERLQKAAILRTESGRLLKSSAALRMVPSSFRDEEGSPLLADLKDELYLSLRYDDELSSIARHDLRLRTLDLQDVLPRIQADLQSSTSRIKGSNTKEDWHTRLADYLYDCFNGPFKFENIHKVGSLRLVPVQNNLWAAPASRAIYLPQTDGAIVPRDIGFLLVPMNAASNSARLRLYRRLGVTKCSPAEVISKIAKSYEGAEHPGRKLRDSNDHLLYLYWYQSTGKTIPTFSMRLFDKEEKLCRSSELYLESDAEFAAQSLFKKRDKLNAPGRFIHFLHPSYLGSDPASPLLAWLETTFGISDAPQLTSSANQDELAEDFSYLTNYRGDALVGTLKAHYPRYQYKLTLELLLTLQWTDVPCENGGLEALCRTWLPLPSLKMSAAELGVADQMPFLSISESLVSSVSHDLDFWRRLDVRYKLGFFFFLTALRLYDTQASDINGDSNLPETMLRIYDGIIRSERSSTQDEVVRDECTLNQKICVPANDNKGYDWVTADECVWEAPYQPVTKYWLAQVPQYAKGMLSSFFQDVLKIKDFDWQDSLAELRHAKCSMPAGREERLHTIYHHLDANVPDDKQSLCQAFESESLIYVTATKQWRPPSSCLWATSTAMPDKAAISDSYISLEAFFTKVLGVPTPNISMLVKGLRKLSRSEPCIADVKRAIQEINLMGPDLNSSYMRELLTCNILPARQPSGQETLLSPDAEFAIIDRNKFTIPFNGRITSLAFTVDEIRQLQPFLRGLGLEQKHLTYLVKEASKVKESQLDINLTQQIRKKAYVLLCSAIHFDTARIAGNPQGSRTHDEVLLLYDLLRKATVYTSSGISQTMSTIQNGKDVTVTAEKCTLHLEQNDKSLSIYVPKRPAAQEQCYQQQLPRRFATMFNTIRPEAEALLTRILTSQHTETIYDILAEDGIIDVKDLLSEGPDHHYEVSETIEIARDESTPPPSRATSREPLRATSRTESSSESTHTRYHGFSDTGPRFASARTPGPTYEPEANSRYSRSASNTRVEQVPPVLNDAYVALLENVIKSARTARFPSQQSTAASRPASFSRTDLTTGSIDLLDSPFGDRLKDRLAHDRKLGAAGELYVFELLSKHSLSGFSRDNWQSSIRKEVRVHDKYRDLEPWTGRETADITYTDSQGELTKLLVDKGHMTSTESIMLSRLGTVKYFIEVKSTTKQCDEKFFMSNAQYRRMRQMFIQNAVIEKAEVYIILRVYNLGKSDMAMEVYLDPEALRREHKLSFTAESWSVTPTQSFVFCSSES